MNSESLPSSVICCKNESMHFCAKPSLPRAKLAARTKKICSSMRLKPWPPPLKHQRHRKTFPMNRSKWQDTSASAVAANHWMPRYPEKSFVMSNLNQNASVRMTAQPWWKSASRRASNWTSFPRRSG